MQILQKKKKKKKKSSSAIYFLSYHFGQIYSSHIPRSTKSPLFSVTFLQGIYQILQVVPSYSSSLLSSFDDSAKLLHCHDEPGCCFSWRISSLTTVPDGIFCLISLHWTFWPYFAALNLWVCCSLRHLHFLG